VLNYFHCYCLFRNENYVEFQYSKIKYKEKIIIYFLLKIEDHNY